MGDGIEVLQKRFRDDGEVGTPADLVEIGEEAIAGPAEGTAVAGVQEAVILEAPQVPGELLTIEVRESASTLWIQ